MLTIDQPKILPPDTNLEGTAPAQGSDEAQFAQAATEMFARDAQPNTGADLTPLAGRLQEEFSRAETDKQTTEVRWLKSLRQYKGIYDPEVEKDLKNRSRAFVRKTRVKVKTVDSRMGDLTFPAGREKNWTLGATPKPSIDPSVQKGLADQLAQAAQGKTPPEEVVEGAVKELADKSAKEMDKVIEDQLSEIHYKKASLATQHSGHLYGTGILKGPLVERRVRVRYVQTNNGWEAKHEEYLVPFIENVPVWRWYPDMNATDLSQCEFVWERHIQSKAGMLELARRPSFNRQKLVDYIKANPRGQVTHKMFDSELKTLGERFANQTTTTGQYEILERWGWLDGEDLKSVGVDVPPERLHETFFSNIWMLPNGEIVKAVLQPITGVTWPYFLYYFDKDETSIFADGIPDVMRDDQENLNAAVRMMLDNGAITSGPMVEIFLDLLAKTDKAEEIGPWKTYFRNSKDRTQTAVRPIEIPNNLEWLKPLADMFDSYSDETTAVPKYTAGDNPTNGAAGTSSGLSMLMGAVNIVFKDLLTDWDEVTRDFITALYRWNMKFNSDQKIKGDFDVTVRGTASLIAKEVRAQLLEQFAAGSANALDAPYIDRLKLLRARAEAHELSEIVKTDDQIEADHNSPQAKQMQELQQRMQAAQLAEAEAKAVRLQAEAQRAQEQANLIIAQAKDQMARIDETIARTVQVRVETIFSALQGGGVATRDPVIAPAGDEILRSAGYKDITPSPSIAQLDGPPVQQQATDQTLLNKGQSFATDPRAPAQAPQDPAQGVPTTVHSLQPQPSGAGPAPGAEQLPTSGRGEEHGIQTTRIES